MTREETKEILENMGFALQEYMNPNEMDAIDMAISALSADSNCNNCKEYGSYKCTRCDGEIYYKADGDLISRADAVKAIQDGYCACVSDCIDEINKLLNVGTDCTDFIHWLCDEVLNEELWEVNAIAYGEIIARKLKKLGLLEVKDGCYIRPSTEAVEGEWIKKRVDGRGIHHGFCSKCGFNVKRNYNYNYCPNCGKKMKLEVKDI